MPTYTNNYSQPIIVKDSKGRDFSLNPGETIETFFFSNDANLTLDATEPLFRQVISITSVTAGGDDLDIDPDCDYILVEQISDVMTVHVNEGNTEDLHFLLRTANDPVIPIKSKGIVSKLIFSGSGTAVVSQYREFPV